MVHVADAPVARSRGIVRGDLCAAAARQPDRRDVGGLHPYGSREGVARAPRRAPPRHSRRDHADRNRGGSRYRRAARRSDPDRDGVQHPWHRASRVRLDPQWGSADDPGHGIAGRLLHRDGEPDRRRPVRVHRPAGSLLVSPLLEVEDLRVEFVTDDGIVHAVDGISYAVQSGKTRGIGGESGSGKTVGSLTVMGLTRARDTRISGRIMFEGSNLLELAPEKMRRIRGNQIAMIFQDPLSSLHPFYKIGFQLSEAIIA